MSVIPSVLSVEAGGREVRGRTPARSSLSEHNGRTWSRRFSPNRGDYLKVEDEVRGNVSYICINNLFKMSTINRGGKKIQIVRKTSHHVPIVVLGHLDTKGLII